jgi:RNA polymerase sigma factor (sigma-70 family)
LTTKEVSARTQSSKEQLLAHLPAINAIVGFIGRRYHLRTDELEEFRSTVQVKLIEDDYAVLRKFRGESSLKTYLTTVIQRIFLDERVRAWGRWRPSAIARRRGPIAILFEQLVVRDHRPFDEACAVIERERDVAVDRRALAELYEQLPVRTRPRAVDSEEALTNAVASGSPEDGVLDTERAAAAARTADALRRALAGLAPQDRLIVKLRFEDGLSVAQIARATSDDQKLLYRRFDRVARDLRVALEAEGVDGQVVMDALGNAHVDFEGALGPVRTEMSQRARLKVGPAEQRRQNL